MNSISSQGKRRNFLNLNVGLQASVLREKLRAHKNLKFNFSAESLSNQKAARPQILALSWNKKTEKILAPSQRQHGLMSRENERVGCFSPLAIAESPLFPLEWPRGRCWQPTDLFPSKVVIRFARARCWSALLEQGVDPLLSIFSNVSNLKIVIGVSFKTLDEICPTDSAHILFSLLIKGFLLLNWVLLISGAVKKDLLSFGDWFCEHPKVKCFSDVFPLFELEEKKFWVWCDFTTKMKEGLIFRQNSHRWHPATFVSVVFLRSCCDAWCKLLAVPFRYFKWPPKLQFWELFNHSFWKNSVYKTPGNISEDQSNKACVRKSDYYENH